MARTNIDVIITVRDGASKPLENVEKKLRNTGKAAKEVSADIWQFNKTMFSTVAFLGLFTRAFSSLKSAMDVGAELDRVTVQFERVLGPRGEFLSTLRSTTNSVVDEFSAMQTGLHLGQLGITKSSSDAASVIAKMAVAARMAGKDASEGVKDLTQAIEDGNIAKLQEYGIMKKYDPTYMAMIATMNKAGGIYGATIVKQQQLALVMKQLTKHTQDHMFMWMSTGELVSAVGKKFTDLRQHIGTFIATALRPFMEKLIPFMDKLSDTLFYLYRNDKQIMFLTRSVLALSAGLASLLAVLGTLKLTIKLLGFAGFGLPGLTMAVLGLGAAFVGLTKDADGVLEKFRVIGAIFKGVYELVSNLDPETGMSKISKSTRDLLEKYGLLGFTKTIARIIAVIKTVLQDIYKVFKTTAKVVDDVFGGMFTKFKDAIASFTSSWTTWWTSDAISPIQKFVRAATTIIAPLLAFFAGKKIFGSIFSKIPGMGGFFGGGSKNGPSGTASDPIHVVGAGIGGGGLGGALGSTILKGPLEKLTLWFNNLILKSKILSEILTHPGGKLKGLMTVLSSSLSFIPKLLTSALINVGVILTSSIPELVAMLGVAAAGAITLIAGAVAAAAGVAIGKGINWALDKYTQGKTKEGYEGNILERGIFKLFADEKTKKQFSDFEKFKNTDDIELVNDFRKKQGKAPLTPEEEARLKNSKGSKQTNVAVPTVPADDLAIVTALTEQMHGMSAEKAAEMKSAIEQALATKESDGRFISPDEFSSLQDLFVKALDSSENLTTLANKAKENRITRPPNRPY